MTDNVLDTARRSVITRMVGTGLAAMICSTSLPVLAQDGDDNADADGLLEEVVVTGFRKSLATSLSIKRDSAVMVDSIVAEDIGKFPDNNLAESMARIPGVTISSRTEGQGKNISVRGLNSTFTRTQINGMEVNAIDWGTTSRSFDFNRFASDLFTRIDVMKTTDASMQEGSLGATVGLFTSRPLDSDENRLVLGASAGYNENAEEVDPRITALLSMQNDAGTFGAAFSLAYSDLTLASETHNSGRWEANTGEGINQWANAASLPDEINNAFHPRFPRYFNDYTENESLGLTGALQWQPTDSTAFTLDMLYSTLDQYQSGPALTPISMSRTHPGGRIQTTVNDYEYDPSRNALVYAALSGVDIRSENRDRNADSDFYQVSLNFDQDFGDNVHLHVLTGTSESTTGGLESLAILEAFNQDLTYDYRSSQSAPVLTYGFDVEDPSNWLISEVRFANSDVKNAYDTIKADLAWDINDTFTLSGGVSQQEFEFDLNNLNKNTNLHADANQGVVNPPPGCNITQDQILVGSNLGSVYTDWTGQSYFLADWDPYAAQVGFPPGGSSTDPCFPLSPGSSGRRNVTEDSIGGYLQLDFTGDLGNMAFFGNVGVRYVETDVSSTGDIATDPVTVDRTYDDTLPAFNSGLWVTETVLVRASWAEVMSRPVLSDLTPGGSVDGFNRLYSAGNPGLDPFRATNIDLAVEWYFADEGLVSLAYFNKDIESFPSSLTVTVPWPELGLPDSLLDSSPATPADLFDYSSTFNGEGGELYGWEAQLQTPLNFGPDWVRNFGVRLNYTDITSEVNHGTSAEPNYGRLLGQADQAYNGTLWYENDAGLEARVSYTYTGDSAQRAISRFTRPGTVDAGEDTFDETAYVDAKVAYQFTDALTVYLDMLNLTNETTRQLMGSNGFNLEDNAIRSGRQWYLGVQYSIW